MKHDSSFPISGFILGIILAIPIIALMDKADEKRNDWKASVERRLDSLERTNDAP